MTKPENETDVLQTEDLGGKLQTTDHISTLAQKTGSQTGFPIGWIQQL